MIKIIDNFLSERVYNDLLAQIACGPFVDEVNPVDGVTYPHICQQIPNSVDAEVTTAVPGEYLHFLRASPAGVHCPHPVHHDGSMGRISLMLYTSNIGGTALMKHKLLGVMAASQSNVITNRLIEDSDKVEAWEVMEVAEAKPNRAAIFDAALLHAALPFGGAGKGAKARTVYTRFIR